jgi:hypothetical protein
VRACRFSPAFIDFPAAGVPTNRLLLASGALIHDSGMEALEGAWGDLDALLDVHEKDVLLKLIKRRMHAGAEAANGLLPDLNATRIRDWLSAFPAVAHGAEDWEHHRHTKVVLDKVVAAGRALASHFRDPLHIRRLASEAGDGAPELEDSTYRALQAVPDGLPEGTRSMSCGDPRGNNLADFGVAAAMYAAQYGGGGGSGDVTGAAAYDPYTAGASTGYDTGYPAPDAGGAYPYTTGNSYGEWEGELGLSARGAPTLPPPLSPAPPACGRHRGHGVPVGRRQRGPAVPAWLWAGGGRLRCWRAAAAAAAVELRPGRGDERRPARLGGFGGGAGLLGSQRLGGGHRGGARRRRRWHGA